jgi:hypothetical protein
LKFIKEIYKGFKTSWLAFVQFAYAYILLLGTSIVLLMLLAARVILVSSAKSVDSELFNKDLSIKK